MFLFLLAGCIAVGALACLMFATSTSPSPRVPPRLLTRLSLIHCPPRAPVPAPPTNEERLHAYRSQLPAVSANSYPWKHRQTALLHQLPPRVVLRVVSNRHPSRV